MNKAGILLGLCGISLFGYAGNALADLSSRDELLPAQENESLKKNELVKEETAAKEMEDGIGAENVSEDPKEHSIAHNTHQAAKSILHDTHQTTKSILHNTHQGTKKVLHKTTDGLKEGTNFVTSSIADGVSKGSQAVSDFFSKIGGT